MNNTPGLKKLEHTCILQASAALHSFLQGFKFLSSLFPPEASSQGFWYLLQALRRPKHMMLSHSALLTARIISTAGAGALLAHAQPCSSHRVFNGARQAESVSKSWQLQSPNHFRSVTHRAPPL